MNFNMELKINNTIITDDLEKLDFSELKRGQQILTFESKSYTDNDCNEIFYNDFKIYLLRSILLNAAYVFDKIETNVSIDEDSYTDSLEMESSADEKIVTYLKIKDSFLNVGGIDCLEDIEEFKESNELDYENFYNLNQCLTAYGSETGRYSRILDSSKVLQEMLPPDSNIMEEYHEDRPQYKIDKYFIIDLETSRLGIKIQNKICPSIYKWSTDIDFFLFDNEFKTFSVVEIEKKDIPKLISIIEKEYWDFYSKDCLEHLNIYISKLSDIRRDNKLKQLIHKHYNIFHMPSFDVFGTIDKLINPIYVDEENQYKAYLREPYAYYSVRLDLDYKYSSDEEERKKINRFSIKSEAIINHLTKSNPIIDIYTGEVVNKRCKIQYSDYEYIVVIKEGNYKLVYTRMDEIFVPVTSYKEKENILQEVEERSKMCNLLTS